MVFFYVYKALAHPEKNGYVQPVTLEERLAHIAAAKGQLGTKIPWLADTMKNDLKHAFGDRNNSEFVISPEGKVLIARAWSDPDTLRTDLEELVGKADTLTEISDLDRPTPVTKESKVASGIVPKVDRPSGSEPLVITAAQNEKGEPLYLKVRAEAPSSLTREGKGPLHLGFHLDPIHHVHWNNLAPPLQFEITAPEGVSVTPAKGEAAKVTEADADSDPRQFLIDVDRGSSDEPLQLSVTYFACDDGDKWCKAVTQEFTIDWKVDRDAGRVQSRGGSGKGSQPGAGRGRPGGKGMPDPSRILSRYDSNEDGKISKDEATGPMAQRFGQMDKDEDGFVTKEELEAGVQGQRRP